MKKWSDKIASFQDLVEFIESAAESANDPIYRRDDLQRTEERTRSSVNTDSSKRLMKVKPKSTSWRFMEIYKGN